MSIVFGIPITRTPIWWRRAATLRVSSPPIAIRTSIPNFSRYISIRATSSSFLNGLVRDVPRMVPPLGRIPVTEQSVRGSTLPSTMPFQPFRIPMTE